jgi:hypothetical protein
VVNRGPEIPLVIGVHGKTVGKPLENRGKTMGKPWENMGKPWENHGTIPKMEAAVV